MKHMYYFGCIGQVGHHLHDMSQRMLGSLHTAKVLLKVPENLLRCLDGNFVPTETQQAGLYKYSTIGECQIVAWHDYSVDKRPGSNSVLIGIGFIDSEDMLDWAEKHFPSVMQRQKRPKPINLHAII